jgi:hypothetical protein
MQPVSTGAVACRVPTDDGPGGETRRRAAAALSRLFAGSRFFVEDAAAPVDFPFSDFRSTVLA